MRERKFGRRVGIASLVAVCAVAAFAVIGGTGLAKDLANPGNAQYGAGGQYHGKVTICHKGHVTIKVAMVAWFRAHQRHGDTMGPCSAAAVKAAKVKAAKLKGKQSQVTTEDTATTSTGSNGKGHGPKGPKQTSSSAGGTQTAAAGTATGPPSGHGNGNGNGNGHGKNG
jgi:hypothetical protein